MCVNALLFLCLFFNVHSRMLDNNEKMEAVHMHNLLRRSVVPSASNMRQLEYSDEMAAVASTYVDQCILSHMYGPQGYGENGRLASDGNVTKTVMNWFQERVYYDWSKPYGARCYVRNEEDNFLTSATCGHYTMMTTYTVTKVGCAINFCPTATVPNQENISNVYLTFCFYDKGPRDYPYSPGKPCTGCDDMSNQYCLEGLCVPKSQPNSQCKVVCKRCQQIPTWIAGMCACECDVGNDNDCSGYDKYATDDPGCLPCESLGTPCLNGGTDTSTNKDFCQCSCLAGFSGNNCEVTPAIATDMANSAIVTVYGESWYFGFRYPVDKYEFIRKWKEVFQQRIEKDIGDYCLSNKCGVVESSNAKLTVAMVEGYPILNEKGALTLKIYAKKNGQYINKKIIQDVISKNSGNGTSYLLGFVNV